MPLIESYEELVPLLEQGFFYAFGRDRQMRPNLIMNARKVIDSGITLE